MSVEFWEKNSRWVCYVVKAKFFINKLQSIHTLAFSCPLLVSLQIQTKTNETYRKYVAGPQWPQFSDWFLSFCNFYMAISFFYSWDDDNKMWFLAGMHGAAFFCFGAGRGRRYFFRGGAGRGGAGIKIHGAGRGKGQTLPGRGIFGAGQKDRKTINQCWDQCP